MKNIWIFNHYATKPDEPTTRAYEIGRELVVRGHKVTVFASSFSHYRFKEKYLAPKEKWKKENYNGVCFIWIKTFPYRKNNWRRFLNMLSYGWRAYWIAKKIKEKPDVIIGTCVHPFAALAAYLAARAKKSRFFFEITDLWPQSIIDMGIISKYHPLAQILFLIEKILFKKAEKIIILPPHIDEYIIKRGVPKEKIVWIPNGLDLSLYEGGKKYKGGKSEKVIIMYAGIFSKYAGLDTILKAAKILKDKGNRKIEFILVGDGYEKPKLIKMAKDFKLENLKFHNLVPKKEVLKLYEKADAFVCTIKNIVSWVGVSSKKLNDYMAFGRPIIFAVDSKNNPVEKARAGITIPPEDPQALARAAEKIASLSPRERIKMANNAREYAKENLDIKVMAKKLESLL